MPLWNEQSNKERENVLVSASNSRGTSSTHDIDFLQLFEIERAVNVITYVKLDFIQALNNPKAFDDVNYLH